MSLFLYFLNKTFTVIWYLKPLISSNKYRNKFSMLYLLASNCPKESFESNVNFISSCIPPNAFDIS